MDGTADEERTKSDAAFDAAAFVKEAASFSALVDRIEDRCLAADGPVTPTLAEMTEKELATLWRHVQALRTGADAFVRRQATDHAAAGRREPLDGTESPEAMARRHFNEPILLGFDVGRLVGYAEDEMDCYLVVDHPAGGSRSRRVWHTCVGGYVFLDRLKGQGYVKASTGEDWDDLWRIDSMLAMNGVPKASEFFVEYRSKDGTAADSGEDE